MATMVEAKFTPGPWRVAQMHAQTGMGMNDGAWAVSAPEADDGMGKRIALVDCQTDYKRGQGYKTQCPERDANAALIAAAPDLFDALTKIVDVFGVQFTDGLLSHEEDALAQARAALLRASPSSERKLEGGE